MSSNKRIEWIDIAKGIGIILVLVGHISKNHYLGKIIYAFHMPLFFILSGYIYFINKGNIKYKKTLILYFVFSLLIFGYWALVERRIRNQDNSIIWQAINIIYGAGGPNNYIFNIPLWFIPCFLTTETAFKYIRKVNNNIFMYAILFISSIIGWLIPHITSYRFPLGIDTMFTSLAFYGLGFILGSKYNYIKKQLSGKKNINNILMIILIALFMISYNLNITVDMNNLTYGNYFLYYIASITGSLIIILVSSKINIKTIKWLGKNSMVIMCLHEPIKRILLVITSKVIRLDVDIARENIIFIIINAVLLIIILIPIILIFNNIFNKLLNERRKNEISNNT